MKLCELRFEKLEVNLYNLLLPLNRNLICQTNLRHRTPRRQNPR